MSSSSKTSKRSDSAGSIASFEILPPSGLMRRGRLLKVEKPGSTSFVPAYSCWPSPAVSDAKASRRHGYTITGHPGTTLTDAMLASHGLANSRDPPRVLNPAFCEALLGLPEDWTRLDDARACAALEMQSLQRKPF